MSDRQAMWMGLIVGTAGLVMARSTFDYVFATFYLLGGLYLADRRILEADNPAHP